MAGFSFNGVHSSEISGLTVLDVSRPIMPTYRSTEIIVPNRDGSWFGGFNGYNDIEIKITCVANLREERTIFRQLNTTLLKLQKANIIIDDETDKYYIGIPQPIQFPQKQYTKCKFDIVYKCEPYAYSSQTEYNEYRTIDDDFELDTGYIYPNESSFDWIYTTQYMGLYNHSDQETDIKFTIVGSVENPKITHIESGSVIELDLTLNNQTLEIDTETYTIKVDDENAMQDTVQFFKLQSGVNSFKFEGTDPNCSVSYSWVHKYL